MDGHRKIPNLWDNIPPHLKDLDIFNFSKQLKLLYLLSEQHSELKTTNISICFFFPILCTYLILLIVLFSLKCL